MRRRLGILVSAVLVIGGMAFLDPPAALADTTCTNVPIAGGTTISGNLIVPNGIRCELQPGSKVTGKVIVQPGGALYANGARINGEVFGTDSDIEIIQGSSVGGKVTSINPEEVTDGNGGVICRSTIGGSVTIRDGDVEDDPSDRFLIHNNATDCPGGVNTRINGAVVITNNQSRVQLDSTSVGGSLTCNNNSPNPDGGNNTIAGAIISSSGECAGFE
jgi:hypothetical protein